MKTKGIIISMIKRPKQGPLIFWRLPLSVLKTFSLAEGPILVANCCVSWV